MPYYELIEKKSRTTRDSMLAILPIFFFQCDLWDPTYAKCAIPAA